MNIQPLNFIPNCCHPQQKRMYPNLAPLKADTVSFTAMKKNQFSGTDLMCVERFKAPIEKFNSNEDLQKWAGHKLADIRNYDYLGRREETIIQRKNMLKEWFDYVIDENTAYSNAEALLIMNAVTKDLKPENDRIPPVLNKGVLADTITEIRESKGDIYKTYDKKLRANYLEDINTGETDTKWIIIPSKEHDPDNFEKNVDRLKVLSHKNWCTKSNNAEPYLKEGDFHVYLENGIPKAGIRFIDNEIEEIQGERNNNRLPVDYYHTIEEHIKDYPKSKNAEKEIENAKKTYIKTKKIKKDLENITDTKEIYEYFNIDTKLDTKGRLIISHYKQPSEDYTFTDLGLDEAELFKNVIGIEGDAELKESDIREINNLEFINGSLNISRTGITTLGNLRKLGSLNAAYSKLNDLGKLEIIDKDLNISGTNIKTLFPIKEIGGSLDASYSDLEDLGNIKIINGNMNIKESKVKSLGLLERINGFAELNNTRLTSLDNLEYVGGYAHLYSPNLKSLGKLKRIEGAAFINGLKLESLGNLEYIGASAMFSDSKINDLGKLKYIRMNVYYKNSNLIPEDFKNVKVEGDFCDLY